MKTKVFRHLVKSMRKKSIAKRVLALILSMSLAVGLSACGKKNETPTEEYVYTAKYEQIKTEEENMSTYCTEVNGNMLNSIVAKYDEDYSSVEYFIRITDMVTKEETLKKIEDADLGMEAYPQYLHVSDDGSFGLVVSSYNPETWESLYSLRYYSKDAKVTDSVPLNDAFSNSEFFYVGKVYFNDDKTVVLQLENSIALLDKSGKKIKEVETQSWINGIVKGSDGRYYVSMFDNGQVIKPIKDDFTGFGESLKITANNISLYPGGTGKILISSDSELKSYDLATGVIETVWNWFDVDVEANSILDIVVGEDETMRIITQNWDDNGQYTEIATVKKEKADPSTAKTRVVLGCTYIDHRLKETIKGFNKNNQKYRIVVKNYEDEGLEYEQIRERMNADLVSGAIDIVDLSQNSFNYQKLASKGALAPLDKYFEKSGLNRDDYFTNVFDALSVKGKLYSIASSVAINTIGMSKDYTNGKTSITMEDLLKLRKENIDKDFSDYASKESMLSIILSYAINDFVDADTGKCHFDSEEFTNVLEFANTFKSQDEIDYSDEYDSWAEMKSGNIIMTGLYLSSYEEIQVYSQLMKGGMDIVGYPVSSGSGHIISPEGQLAIASKSKVKDGAWEFMKTFLEEEYQTNDRYSYGLPILKSAFNAKMEEAMKKDTYVDENGVVQEQSHGSWGNGSTTIEIYSASQSDVDSIRSLMESATTLAQYDEQLFDIVSEEAAAYFKGQKDVKDVANAIQSRATIYLAESR